MEHGYKCGGWGESGEVTDNNSRTTIVVAGAEIPSGALSNQVYHRQLNLNMFKTKLTTPPKLTLYHSSVSGNDRTSNHVVT